MVTIPSTKVIKTPTFLLFLNGSEIGRIVGAELEELEEKIGKSVATLPHSNL